MTFLELSIGLMIFFVIFLPALCVMGGLWIFYSSLGKASDSVFQAVKNANPISG